MGRITNAILKRLIKNETKKLTWLDAFTPHFSGTVSPRLNDTFMTCCQTHARHGAKFVPAVYTADNKPSKARQYITDLLSIRPNELLNAPTFWEKVTENYFELNNVFIYPHYDWADYKEPLKALYILDPDSNFMETREGTDGKLYLSFSIQGTQYTVPASDLIHIARNVNASEFFGTDNSAISEVLRVIQTNYEGIQQAIKTSAFLRFIVQTTTMMPDTILEDKANKFAERYLGSKATGVAFIDGAQQIIPVNSQAKYANAEEMNIFEEKMFSYFGLNKKIIQASYNEDAGEWTAYYESSLEPLVMKIEAELTHVLSPAINRARREHIRIEVDRIQNASLKTRVAIAAVVQKLPVYKPNTINYLLFLPPSENGEKEYATLNYVEADKLSQYQGTKGAVKKEEEDDGNAGSNTEKDA